MSPTEFVRQLTAHEGETVEIKWRLADGNVYYQRVTVPPKATRAFRLLNADLVGDPNAKVMQPPDAAAVASVEVDRTIADRPLHCGWVYHGHRCTLLLGHDGSHVTTTDVKPQPLEKPRG